MKDIVVVASTDDMPKRRFQSESTIIISGRGHELHRHVYEARNLLAREIAEKIVRDKDFFKSEELQHGLFFRIGIDAVVVTTNEWRDAMEAQFKRGIEAGLRAYPSDLMGRSK